MADRNFKDEVRTLESAVVELYGQVTFGSSGAISSQACQGFSVAQTAAETGRYTVTLEDSYNSFKGCQVTLEAAADAALTTADGNWAVVRNVSVGTSGGGTFDVQLVRTDTGADADPTSGTVMHLAIKVKNSSLTF